jgi:DNA-binding transcriptional LysR family regulator
MIDRRPLKFSLKQLAVFDAVASLESVSGAAKQLSLTQSAVSMSLSQLESLLECRLLERQGNRMVLTHWGQWLRPKAKKMLLDAQQIELGIADQHLLSGTIMISASQTSAEHLMPSLISKIDGDFPEIHIDLVVENTEHVIEGILDFDYQLGVIEGRCDHSQIEHEAWFDDHLVVVAAKHHPFARFDTMSLAQLEQAQWVLREQGAGTRKIFDGAIHGLIEHLNVWKEYSHVSVLKAMVKNGVYLSCLPYLDVVKEVESGELIVLKTPQLNMRRSLSFIWRKDVSDNPLRDCVLREGHRLVKRHFSQLKLSHFSMTN